MLDKVVVIIWGALVAALLAAPSAWAEFPYPAGSGPAFHTGAGQTPDDWTGDDNEFKFAATPQDNNVPVNNQPMELCGIRGASVVDDHPTYPFPACPGPGSAISRPVNTAWMVSTGRPDVTIAVLDSGIKWNETDTEQDLRRKVRLNRGELGGARLPHVSGPVEAGIDCSPYTAGTFDANHDGVFNAMDYACDERIHLSDSRRAGPANMLTPQDVTIAFSNGADEDGNGFADDIAGWDFVDNDNDPYDDVQYGHGTGEAKDSSAEAGNGAQGGGQTGTCPNCMVVPLRVGDSFVADINRFAQAAIYAVDNDVLVIQEALGALNNSRLARQAVEYAYDHGVTIIASAADEAAQHHHWPEGYPHVIVVNSVTNSGAETQPPSYLRFNGCTNFSSKITIAVPSTSCSSNATGLGAGMAGLVYSAALNAHDAGRLPSNPSCHRVGGANCVISANEVRQLMASGSVGSESQADDVNFASPGGEPEPTCSPKPALGCTDPNTDLQAEVDAHRPVLPGLVATRSYPARKGFDQFYGWGRVNTRRAVKVADDGTMPPEAEITGPDWFAQIDPAQPTISIRGHVDARGAQYKCRVFVAPGSYPNNALNTASPPGDFHEVPSPPGVCDNTTRTAAADGVIGEITTATLKQYFPAQAGSFNGPESGSTGAQTANGRPNVEPFGFTVRVEATTVTTPRTGRDTRNFYLHRDQDLASGWPKQLTGDGESSPLFVDLDGDNRNEMVLGTADGIVHAFRADGSEIAGWPVRGDDLPLHTGGSAFSSGAVSASAGGAFLSSLAAADLDRDGVPEVVGADFEGRIYAWDAEGHLAWKREATPAFSGKPLDAFTNVRRGKGWRTQHGFIASPVVADLDHDGQPEVIAAGMDRHVYAFRGADGATVPGFPVLVTDRSKLSAIDPTTHALTFDPSKQGCDDPLNMGAIIDTPAVGDITGDGKAEIVVGTNEEYKINTSDDCGAEAGKDGPLAAGNFNAASLGVLTHAGIPGLDGLGDSNGRMYAIKSTGDPGGPTVSGPSPFIDGWPVKIARLKSELLPVVGEGITGAPVIGPSGMTCPHEVAGPKVGVIPDGGPGYILNKDGSSCYDNDPSNGQRNALQTDGGPNSDHPAIPAVGHPAFGDLGGNPTFLAPATGALRAADLALNEYQTGGQDFVAAWDATSGQFRPGFPARVNDLQFLTGPSVADVDGLPGQEVVAGTAYLDLQAFDAAGAPVNARWPKLTSDWMVANPLIGSFGTLDTDAAARKVVVALTRDGRVFVYKTDAPACSPGSWPRFHHDNANSGYYDRDAVAPGKPYGATVDATSVKFKAPGDDLLCGTLAAGTGGAKYEAVQSADPITPANFSAGESIPAPATGGAPASTVTLALPAGVKRYVAVRAVDEQGNVGRPLVVDRVGGTGATGETGGAGGPGGSGGNGAGGGGSCTDHIAPQARFARRGLRGSRRGFTLAGTITDGGCGTRLRRVEVAIARQVPGGCRFLSARGKFGRAIRRGCPRPRYVLRAKVRGARWSFSRRLRLTRGRYVVLVRALDVAGNRQRRPLVFRLRIR